MNIIVNSTNLRRGGILQIALSFIEEIREKSQHTFHIFISSHITDQLDKKSFPQNFHFYEFKHSPYSLAFGLLVILRLKKLERKLKPDCVFSFGGPTYWSPRSPHVMGFARGYYIYPEYLSRVKFSFKKHSSILIKKTLHKYLYKKNARFYVVQTHDVAKRLSSFIGINRDQIFTVSNTHHPIFNKKITDLEFLPPRDKDEFRLISITAYYQHKNLEILNEIFPYLVGSGINLKIILTLPEHIIQKKFEKSKDYIINAGPVPISDCPYLYSNADAVFLPTLIECFSASYPEAMKMGKPILTSDLSFARDICGDSAEYFDPFKPAEIADKIIGLARDTKRQQELIRNGTVQLSKFEGSASRAKKYLEVCEKVSNTLS